MCKAQPNLITIKGAYTGWDGGKPGGHLHRCIQSLPLTEYNDATRNISLFNFIQILNPRHTNLTITAGNSKKKQKQKKKEGKKGIKKENDQYKILKSSVRCLTHKRNFTTLQGQTRHRLKSKRPVQQL